MRCYKNLCFYIGKAVEARIEAGLNEFRWSIHGIGDVAKTIVFNNEEAVEAVSRQASMSFDGASMANEMLQRPLFLQ